MSSRLQRGRWAWAVACLLLISAPAAASDLEVRPYKVHYRPLIDAADLIDPLLSDDGRIILRPRLDTLLVEDRPEILDKIEALLERYDLPPANIEITFSLFLGKREDDPEAPQQDYGLSQEVRGVLEQLSDFTKWTTYEPLGSRSVKGTEGDRVVARLSPEFRVVFTVESIHETHGAVKFESLQLQRIRLDDEGDEQIEDLYRAGMVLPRGELHLVGAATDPNSKRALFLALQTPAR